MSTDSNKTQDERRILREITAVVNNSPSILTERFRCLRINETFESDAGSNSFNIEESSDRQVSTVLKVSGTAEDSIHADQSINLWNISEQPLSSVLENINGNDGRCLLDNTIQCIQLNTTETPDCVIDDLNSSNVVQQEKLLSHQTATDLESLSDVLNFSEIATKNSIKPEDSSIIKSPSNLLTPSENQEKFTKSIETDISIECERKSLNVSEAALNIPETVEFVDSERKSSNISEAAINETVESVNSEKKSLNISETVEEKACELNNTDEKVDPESNISISSNISDQPNFTINQQEILSELDDTTILCNTKSPEDSEGCVASEEYVTPTDEIFQDPKTFDFLLRNSGSCSSNNKRLESLYVKFDPLYAPNMLPQNNSIPENEGQNEKQVTDLNSPKHKEENIESPNIEIPTDETSTRNSLTTVDKLTSVLTVDAKPPVVIKGTEEADNSQIADLVKELNIVKAKYSNLQKKYDESNAINQKLNVVVDEYEQSISRIIAKSETERAALQREKEKLQEHLSNSEAAFNDVHEKYERLKTLIQTLNSNEEALKEAIQENLRTIEAIENRYQILKNHATEQLEKANIGLITERKQHEAELLKERAKLAKFELQCKSLTDTVEQKTRENNELSKIIDGLIAPVGHKQ